MSLRYSYSKWSRNINPVTLKFIQIALLALIVVAVVPISVNAAQRVFDPTMKLHNSFGAQRIERYDDPDFQVKCWIIDGDREAGVSCLPWNQVKER
jgi:hypothetical protein